MNLSEIFTFSHLGNFTSTKSQINNFYILLLFSSTEKSTFQLQTQFRLHTLSSCTATLSALHTDSSWQPVDGPEIQRQIGTLSRGFVVGFVQFDCL